MRIAIFSDIHGNLAALERVLEHYGGLQIDQYVCLGDVVGYGPDPQQCCELVRPLVSHCILGNHDAAVCGRMDYAYYYDAARTALDHHAAQLSPQNMEWLRSLPYLAYQGDLCFSHGSPINVENFDYVFNLNQAQALVRHWDALRHVTFIGHSHLTKAFSIGRDFGTPIEELEPPLMRFLPERKYIVTVGSVGQPRDNDARACATVLDTDAMTLEFVRLDYDICKTARQILAEGRLSPDFGKRLFLGI